MAAPIGNRYAAKAATITRSIERALAQDNYRRLHAGIDRVVEAFANGDRWAIEWCTDRVEGRAVARIERTDNDARELDLAAVMRMVMQSRTQEAQDVECVSLPGADENHSRSDPAARLDPPIPQIGEAGGVVEAEASPTIAAKNEEPE